MLWIFGKVGRGEKCFGDGQAGGAEFRFPVEVIAETNQTLRRDGGGGGIDGLKFVEWVGIL